MANVKVMMVESVEGFSVSIHLSFLQLAIRLAHQDLQNLLFVKVNVCLKREFSNETFLDFNSYSKEKKI